MHGCHTAAQRWCVLNICFSYTCVLSLTCLLHFAEQYPWNLTSQLLQLSAQCDAMCRGTEDISQALTLVRTRILGGTLGAQDVSRDLLEHCLRTQVCICVCVRSDYHMLCTRNSAVTVNCCSSSVMLFLMAVRLPVGLPCGGLGDQNIWRVSTQRLSAPSVVHGIPALCRRLVAGVFFS